MEKLALHFGAGNIGRGFIAPVLQENNFRVIFVDIDEKLINKINKDREKRIRNQKRPCAFQVITDFATIPRDSSNRYIE